MTTGAGRVAAQARDDALDTARGRGFETGLLATLISAMALAFSGYSFYEAVLRAPAIAVFVPPRIDYTDPDRPDSPFEVFVIPVTLANDGAQTGTVLSMDLTVKNPRTGETKRFYSANVGPWAQPPTTPFAPVSLAGRASFSAPIQFWPRVGETAPRILDLEAGSYAFELTLNVAAPEGGLLGGAAIVNPLTFERQIGQLDYRNFNGPGTMAMWSTDYQPTATRP
ncbi:MAG: hypothetical protein NW205_00865 [Hyphomicrobiaceae bacterium]|nr:hypothetical protein [Hyphomicrobiaceae bacterium]